jgi:hypothetical protein
LTYFLPIVRLDNAQDFEIFGFLRCTFLFTVIAGIAAAAYGLTRVVACATGG